MINPGLDRPFRLGIVGGAPPSMIGPVHRMAAAMDGRFVLVAGVPSSRPERGRAEGAAIGLPADRVYDNAEAMLAGEAGRSDGIEAVAIITPNDSHATYLRSALAAGLDVMMEKPLCNSLEEAVRLGELAARSGLAVALAHTYAGYPMLRDMRARIAAGEIGAVRLVLVEYLAGGLATAVETIGPKRWRLDPAISGPSLVLGDIGTHAHHLVGFVTGLPMLSVSADVGTLLPGRHVDDVAQVRFVLRGGARGRLDACNAAAGMSNHLAIRVFGETGHFAWEHRNHTRLARANLDGDITSIGAGQPNLTEAGESALRLRRPGHPEGLIEAVANLYCGLADRMLARRGLAPETGSSGLTPSIEDGVAGLAFVTACLRSSENGGVVTALAGLAGMPVDIATSASPVISPV